MPSPSLLLLSAVFRPGSCLCGGNTLAEMSQRDSPFGSFSLYVPPLRHSRCAFTLTYMLRTLIPMFPGMYERIYFRSLSHFAIACSMCG